ncbi:acyl carrier protein [Chengkuizengella sp. SCS-71B]|uniref:acyl carrier protein n=1 Tax=Chengkuizengella sp. SCS-71B TaxID=3115290 RepID=UPI0032C21EEE
MNSVLQILQDVRPDINFGKSNHFINDGILDSFDIISLVSIIDKEFEISISGLEIIPENFTDLGTIKDLIERSGGKV